MKKLLCTLLYCLTVAAICYAQTTTDVDDIVEKGIRLYKEGKYGAALEQYQQALQLNRKSPEANYEMALTYFAMKDMPNAIRYSNAVTKLRIAEPELRAQAFVTKGSALDVSGKPEQALKEYKKGIKLAPRYYLPYYNMGLTFYNQNKYTEAEEALIKAVQLKPGHSSSHLLLSYTKKAQKQRVQSLLALYTFLLLEPDSERAATAFELLQQLQQEGVTKGDSRTTNILVSADKMEGNPFSAAELMLSMTQASNTIEEKEVRTPEQLFYENTQSFFNMLVELRKDQQGFWWDYYVEFFYEMSLDKHVETFSYYISQSKSKEAKSWLTKHPERVEELTSWHQNYKR